MYLKRIEVQGFKSFAHKIVFEFHNGITGIVGPNGSGKSNVADAVRWVLGEQKIKQLRSASMQDVIFAGTEARKPQGFAHVSITFDNSDHALAIDYDEVTVSRRIYRSGESEYMLNGSQCRLRDINELFYDTGIGKEGYSIIGQGQIDKILSGRPEDRRELFDEAAGIVKFKRRKAVAQKKLDEEQANLQRVGDILSELEKQVGPLEKQAETAREYLRLRDELKHYEVNLFLSEIGTIEEQIAGQEEKKRIADHDLEESKQESDRLREEFEKISKEIELLDRTISEQQNAANEARLRAENLDGQIGVLNAEIKSEEMTAERIKQQIADTDSKIAEKEQEKATYQEEKDELADQVSAMKLALVSSEQANIDAGKRVADLEQEIEDEKAALIAALNEKSELSGKKQRYDTLLEQAQTQRSELAQKLLTAKSDEEAQEARIKEQENLLKEIDGEISKLLDEADVLEAEKKEAGDAVAQLNRDLNNTQQDYHTAHTKLESLRNLAERYEGYGNSIRRVMEQRSQMRGIRGVVADLIEVPKEYEIAIETALGGNIQNIVTDTEETAKLLIEHLKKNQYGRATFLPLSGINGRGGFTEAGALKERGALGVAKDLVGARKEYAELVNYLLGRVLVVDTIDNAIAIARKYRHSLRVVTLEGELLSPGGSMSGGAFRNSSNLLSRKREMDELNAICTSALAKIDRIQKNLLFQEGIFEDKDSDLEFAKEQLQNKYIEENTVKVTLEQLYKERDNATDSSADMNRENTALENNIREIQGQIDDLNRTMTEVDKVNEDRSRRIGEAEKALEEAKKQHDDTAKALADTQIEAAKVSQQDGFIDRNIERVSGEIDTLCQEKEDLANQTVGSGASVETKRLQIKELQGQIDEANALAEQCNAKASEAKEKKKEKSDGQTQVIDKRDALAERISDLEKEQIRLQNQLERLEERRESSVNHIWTEYELTYSSAESLRDESLTSVPEMRRQITDRRDRIKGLGHVNVNAIEDYKEVAERYTTMKTQYDDVVAAQEVLFKVIADLDAGMRKQFSEKFAEIRKEFDRVFKELFGGGHGTLELVEDADILEAGVQIISQPPGKKLQSMMQMSGGEKALTAIALLFAIQNLKPSPFCLLDEIEAALDDSNVVRFANYLHKLTKRTQFIVITHRRGTMVAADRLYGITMQEKGVSALVSVNLIENDLN